MKYIITMLILSFSSTLYAQLHISANSGQYYVVPDQLLGVNTPLYPDFLTPVPPCTKCEKSNTASPCMNVGTIACPDTSSSCLGTWRTDMPSQLESDADALQYKAMYYPEGVVSRYYHYEPEGHGFCLNPDEADYINQWTINSGKTNPEVWRRYCNENTYQYANFFEQNIRLCRKETQPSKSMHMVISANVYFGSWSELKRMLEYCEANDVKVDAIVFGSEIEHDQDNTPSRILSNGDTIPFASGGSYFRRVQRVFIDSIKSDPLYVDIPLHFATGIQHGGQGGCMDRTYFCDDTLGKKSLWNRQIHEAIAQYNETHVRQLAYAGAVNWWWNPIFNDTINPSPELAIADMNEFFEVGLSAEGHPLCYKYPGGTSAGEFNGFDEILVVQWGIKKFTNQCNSYGYENRFITQLFIMKRILNMLENNYNLQHNPAASNGLKYTNAFYQRLGSNNGFNPLDFDPDNNTWETENISNYAIRQINSVSGYKFSRAEIQNGPSKNLEAYFLFNCTKQKMVIINYSDTAFTISQLSIDSLVYNQSSLFNFLETSVSATSNNSVLATLNETNQQVPHSDIALDNITIPALGIIEIDLPFLQAPASQEVCNGMDDDCDSEIDESEITYYADADSDGFGKSDTTYLLSACSSTDGFVPDSTDCLDDVATGAAVHPGATELCNGTDDNCNGITDENVKMIFFADGDGDGYGNHAITDSACLAPAGFVADSSDCNDSLAAIHPGAMETCNLLDDDCDGSTDEEVLTSYYADEDGDGYGKPDVVWPACTPPPGYVMNSDDCNDDPENGALIHPAAPELCNVLDDNCNALVDEGVQLVYYADEDGDGFGSLSSTTLACLVPAGYAENSLDCNDSFNGGSIHPQASEVCNYVDDNCDSIIDEGLQSTYFQDADGDSYGNLVLTTTACTTPAGYAENSSDCDDNVLTGIQIFPGATELCNSIDDNCDSNVDEGVVLIFYEDADGDGYGNQLNTTLSCTVPPGYSENNLDCNDSIGAGSMIYPGALESCNGTDDNCNVEIDEGSFIIFFIDADEDGYGSITDQVAACMSPAGFVADSTDCNDSLPGINPGITELCNEADDNCNTLIDEGAFAVFYKDEDGDTFGNNADSILACFIPAGFVANSDDCNDHPLTGSAVHPLAIESCNYVDDDCDNLVDEDVQYSFYADADGDGFGHFETTVLACAVPAGFVTDHSDCDDNAGTGALINPATMEICNLIDDNCNSGIDEGVQLVFYPDEDADGYGNAANPVYACTPSAGVVIDSMDCNDTPGTGMLIHPFASELCNLVDDDCDGITDEDVQLIFYADEDGDGYGNSASTIQACAAPFDYVIDSSDCNDDAGSGGNIFPSAPEICNEVDDNCNTISDEGVQVTFYEDADNDTYGNPAAYTAACVAPAGYVSDNQDCNDNLVSGVLINPGALELCNSIDDDCDFVIDEGVMNSFYSDADGDGYGDSGSTILACMAPDTFVADSTDCNDNAATGAGINPGVTEWCNAIDDNCNYLIDEGVSSAFFADADGDGYGDPDLEMLACSSPQGYVANNFDCDDSPATGATIHPFAIEICNSVDDDCNSLTDENVQQLFYADADGDGFGNPGVTLSACTLPAGYVENSNDCDDHPVDGVLIHPGATEVCNSADDDCDGNSDEGVQSTYFADEDGDGYGNAYSIQYACSLPFGYTTDNTDCNDSLGIGGFIHPFAIEVCNGVDDNCDGTADEGVQLIWFEDKDGDGYGNIFSTQLDCLAPAGYVADSSDCNDSLSVGSIIHPFSTEVCNGTDDNCDGAIDEGVLSTYFADEDGDSYGNPSIIQYGCSPLFGYVADSTDCNDSLSSGIFIHPFATELCNGVDDNCNGTVDEGVQSTWYSDSDGDGYGNIFSTLLACNAPGGYVADNTDCNDSLTTGSFVHPLATEFCNGVDDNCDGTIDEEVQSTWFADEDGDGYGNAFITELACLAPAGYVASNTDCNDSINSGGWIHPAAAEACNGLDDNCNGITDEGIQSWFYVDGDGDNFGNATVPLSACQQPIGYVEDSLDCNDSLFNINPSAAEVCNEADDNCNGLTDENVQTLFYADEDADTYGNEANFIIGCSSVPGYVENDDDCNDDPQTGSLIHPDADELCNLLDDNCDATVDEGVQSVFYADEDEDGFGSALITAIACFAPAGFVANMEDCNDDTITGAAIHPLAPEFCNETDDNCNGAVDEGVQQTFYEDADGDSYGNAGVVISACEVPAGFTGNAADCNDDVSYGAVIHPSALEVCNATDDNCDGEVDENVQSVFYADADGDGFGNASVSIYACLPLPGYLSDSTDCNDDPSNGNTIHPAAMEICNAIDDDCNAITDEGVQSIFYEDEDHDLYGNAQHAILACSAPDGYVADSTDCDDGITAGSAIHPGAAETCNSLDDNCNNETDEGVQSTYYADADGDSYGDAANIVLACNAPYGYVGNNTDCYDDPELGAGVHPDAIETCNGSDDNCNAEVDEGMLLVFYADADADSYGDPGVTSLACTLPEGFSNNNFDCNDQPMAGVSIHPGATEVCNGIDDNCNAAIDEGVLLVFYADADADSYGDPGVTSLACTLPEGFSNNNIDCNDQPMAGASIHPGATEICNGIDDNCNSQTDEGVLDTFYRDADGDSYGTPFITTAACTQPAGYVNNNVDCNDNVGGGSNIHPGVTDLCNLIDDDCNGVIDDHALFPSITPSGTIGMCSNGSILLTANGGGGITYQWLKNNKIISGATNQTYLAKIAATFQVKESNAFACTSTSAGVNTVVWSLPSATITPLGNLNICAAGSVVLEASAGSGYQYQWIKGSNNIAGATNQQYTATTTGTYKVTVTTINGCTKTSTGTKVTKSCKEDAGLATSEPAYFNCYPNPTDGVFMVVLEHAAEMQLQDNPVPVMIELRDALGQLVYFKKDVMNDGLFRREIRLEDHLPQGLYWVRLILPDKMYEEMVVYHH